MGDRRWMQWKASRKCKWKGTLGMSACPWDWYTRLWLRRVDWKVDKEKNKKRKIKRNVSVSTREDHESFYPRVFRIPQVSTRDDERGRDGVLWENGRTKCERFAKRSSKTSNHFMMMQATKKAPRVPTLRLVVKVPALFCYTSDKEVPWNYTSQAIAQEP